MSGSSETINDFIAGFTEEPGYLDFARFGPLGKTVIAEQSAQTEALSRARFGSLNVAFDQDGRVRRAVSALIGFPEAQISFQPNTSMGLVHAMFGSSGVVAMSPAEFPSLPYAATRASDALGRLDIRWLETEYGRVTPGTVRDQLSDDVTAVAVSLVDFRTGYLADLEGIRQVIGDRMLIVDAVQGFSITNAAWTVSDVIVSGGQKWARAGQGTGFLALSERAAEQLEPVLSGWVADDGKMPLDEVRDVVRGAGAFRITHPNSRDQACFAAALEEVAAVGVGVISAAVAGRVDQVIALADEFAIPVTSPRAVAERAGIVVLAPPEDHSTVLTASLFNHGVTVTAHAGTVRLSVHASTGDETLRMLRGAFASYLSAINV
ncbi:MAG TPA: aminotransferase class V-fold PLP-dependent enzyme [Homoserinimonas sp.]|nr:aminotransferase class V-fold PLP-dependent enzyme [Homoserinimonas sp.]